MMENKTTVGTRIGSMFLDHIVMTFIAMIFFLPNVILGFASAFEINHEQSSPNIFWGSIYVLLIGFALYFCKDSFNGRSVAKRALKLQIVENKTGKVASPIKCFIRNIFIIIWPREVIVTLINPSRRIGDLVAGTKVVPFKPDHEQLKINFVQIGLSFVLAYSLLLIVMLPLKVMKSKMESQRINYVESSLNEIAATETEKIFSDSLSSYLNADVRIYDQIQEYSDLKYISVIIRLKENYLESDHDYEHIKSLTMPLLLSKFPKGTFTGQMKFVYQQPGSMQTRTLQLDWREIE